MAPDDNRNRPPILTSECNGIGGRIKSRPSDFQVRERPLYELEGDGPHLYFNVRKTGLSTDGAVDLIANHMDVPAREIGYAGRKDTDAETLQRMSLEHADEESLKQFHHEKIELELLGWHRNKLQPGHLAGNEFTINIRDYNPSNIDQLDRTIKILQSTGIPNYFGPQRFGRRGDTARLGQLMVTDQLDSFVDAYFGRPMEADPEPVHNARASFEAGNFEDAMDHWPDHYQIKRRTLATYIDRQSPKPVLSAIPKSRRQLFVSAFQSQLFNEQTARRIGSLEKVFKGGIAKKTDTGGMFRVEDEEAEQPRATRFEISPTGSLPGPDLWEAEGKQGSIEQAVLEQFDLTLDSFEKVQYLGANGSRRAMRFKQEDLEWSTGSDDHGDYVAVSFFAPSGSYASVLLRELMEPN